MQIARNYLYRTIRRVFLLARIMLLPVAPTPILFVPTVRCERTIIEPARFLPPGAKQQASFFSLYRSTPAFSACRSFVACTHLFRPFVQARVQELCTKRDDTKEIAQLLCSLAGG